MRKIVGICIWLLTLGVVAQPGDTALLRGNKVAAIYKYQYVHAFEKTDDTCLYEVTRLNEQAYTTFHSIDYGCMGYKGKGASEMTYKDGKVHTVREYQDGEMWSFAEYFYKKKEERPERIKIFFYQTNDSAEKKNTYFYSKKRRLDSTLTEEVMQDGSQQTSWTFARYNKKNELVQLYTTDSSYTPQQAITYDLDKNGVMQSMSYQTYGEKPRFSQTFYGYNQEGQLVSTDNQAEQRQVYIYGENGLLTNMLSYNPEGTLEVEYIYTYEYRK